MSENLSPVTAETSSDEDDIDSSKSKSKKKALGAFLVETEPPKKPESFWKTDSKVEAKDPSEKASKTAEKQAEAADELDTDDKIAAIQQLAAARRSEVASETEADSEPASATEIAAAAAFLAAAEALGDTEAAYEQVVAELAAPAETTSEEINTDQPNEGEIDLTTNEPEPEPAEPVTPTPASAASSGGSGPVRPPVTPNQSGGSAGGPPPPNVPPAPFHPGGPQGPNGQAFNTAPTVPTPLPEASVSVDTARANERRALTDGLVVGGIVGYLYGRRRGRIKTEKRLAPVQRKLEKQVKGLQTELLQTEAAVRSQARKLEQTRPRAVAAVTERLQKITQREAIKQPERSNLHQPVAPERIGHVMVAASNVAPLERLKAPAKAAIPENLAAKKRAETMNRGELLALSEKVEVDGTNLRQIYETQLVSEKGLRRLITEHLRGGNVSRALRRELTQHQIDFERDPILRDRGLKADKATVSGGAGKTALSGLLAQAGVSDQPQTEPLGITSRKPNTKDGKTTKQAKKPPLSAIDSALITIITVLVLVIVAVLVRSH